MKLSNWVDLVHDVKSGKWWWRSPSCTGASAIRTDRAEYDSRSDAIAAASKAYPGYEVDAEAIPEAFAGLASAKTGERGAARRVIRKGEFPGQHL